MIDDGEKARRLARAICSDVMLYHPEVKDAPVAERSGLIDGPLLEGRALFLSRVVPALASIFDEEVLELVAKPLGITAPVRPPSVAPRSAAPPSALLREPAPEQQSSSKLVLVVALVLLALAAAAFLLRR